MLRSASRSAAQQGGPPAEPQPPERQKEALKVMGKPRATNHSGKRGAGCAHRWGPVWGAPPAVSRRLAKRDDSCRREPAS